MFDRAVGSLQCCRRDKGTDGGGGERWRVRCSFLHQETDRSEAGGGRKCRLRMSGRRKPQTSHHLEEERCATHYWIQVQLTPVQWLLLATQNLFITCFKSLNFPPVVSGRNEAHLLKYSTWVQFWVSLALFEYFHLMSLCTSVPLHFSGKYCTFYSGTFMTHRYILYKLRFYMKT